MSEKRVYANRVDINTSVYDVLCTFYTMSPLRDEKNIIVGENVVDKAEIYMSPQLAKALAMLLTEQVRIYEENFGEIKFSQMNNNSSEK
ncbi:DUF3467 domain-containing protein [Thermotalea metallivorans]|uniref:DUF3467 domain-containing protein n=1 Tax=Thermotalea metallivorans TaxID=520762 RepID=A0A140LCN0_9FIRM|nr:DUF3467 domain-containing protein [Thermotalea metallivorans]KXG78305.1 hypothetical protein AN619_02800 [Thermotalea metallivorans]